MAERILAKGGDAPRELTLEFVNTLLAVLEEKHPHLRQHCERVANYCTHFCEQFNLLPPKEIDTIYFACLLHDLGLMFSPAEAVSVSEAQADAAKADLKKHPVLAEKLLSGMSLLAKSLPLIRHHHEAWDGSGYPDGRKGEDIPPGARLIALFDHFDWLTAPPFPRQGVDNVTALEEIIQLSGKRFDGALVDQFAQFIETTSGVSKEYIQGRKKETVNMGLTHDIGKTFLVKAFSEEEKVKNLDMKLVITAIQEAHLGISSVMLKRWGFNENFIRAVSLHEKNEFDPAVSQDCLVVNLANMLTRTIGHSLLEGSAPDPDSIRSAQLLGLPPEDIKKLGEETLALVKELAHLF